MTEAHVVRGDLAAGLIEPVARRAPLRDEVRHKLVELIIHHKLAPGEHLRESQLAAQLGVSRVPVREALLALAQEGWVEHRPERGSFVHVPSAQEVEDVFAMRVLLESEAAFLAASRAQPSDIEELRRLCENGRGAVAKNDSQLVVEANADFHRRIREIAGNAELVRILTSIAPRVSWYFTPVALFRGEQSWVEHERIVDALRVGDAAQAREIMAQHTRETWNAYFEAQDGGTRQ
jgi:DNA-binding GntR family transcriptional regulator